MHITPDQPEPRTAASQLNSSQLTSKTETISNAPKNEATREAFQDFVGQTFFAEMIKSLRTAEQPSAYFHGGRAEEIFQGQLDQLLSQHMSEATADTFTGPMFELFSLPRG